MHWLLPEKGINYFKSLHLESSLSYSAIFALIIFSIKYPWQFTSASYHSLGHFLPENDQVSSETILVLREGHLVFCLNQKEKTQTSDLPQILGYIFLCPNYLMNPWAF